MHHYNNYNTNRTYTADLFRSHGVDDFENPTLAILESNEIKL
jgi:hypothetical protein